MPPRKRLKRKHPALPVVLVTGAPTSAKWRREVALAIASSSKAGLIINHAELPPSDDGMVEAVDGCFCCVNRKGLTPAITKLQGKGAEAVVLEGSGVVDVPNLLENHPHVKWVHVVTVVHPSDLESFLWCTATVREWYGPKVKCDADDEEDARSAAEVFMEQLEAAHSIYLTSQSSSLPLREIIQALNPSATCVTSHSEIAVPWSSEPLPAPRKGIISVLMDGAHHKEGDVVSWVLKARKPFLPSALHRLLDGEVSPLRGGGAVLRAMGNVWLAGEDTEAFDILAAGGSWDITKGHQWWGATEEKHWPPQLRERILQDCEGESMDRRQEVAFIGLRSDIEGIAKAFEECMVERGHSLSKEDCELLEKWGASEDSEEGEKVDDDFHCELVIPMLKGSLRVASGDRHTAFPVILNTPESTKDVSLEELWGVALFGDTTHPSSAMKDMYYQKGEEYWKAMPVALRGVELDEMHWYDVKHARRFFAEHNLAGERVLDVGAGIGRFANAVLLDYYKVVDLVEGQQHLLDAAKELLSSNKQWQRYGRAGKFTCCKLQDFAPEGSYDMISICWVLMYLTDDDCISLLKRLVQVLADEGAIYCKENVAEGCELRINPHNSSINRCQEHLNILFSAAGLKVQKESIPSDTPPNTLSATAYLLRRDRCSISSQSSI